MRAPSVEQPQRGTITTVVGTGQLGYSGDGGPAAVAALNRPYGVAIGPDGSLYVADFFNNRVRRVRPDGTISTIVGPAGSVSLNGPSGVAVGPDGSLHVADFFNDCVRHVPQQLVAAGGAGAPDHGREEPPLTRTPFSVPRHIAVGHDGRVYVTGGNGTRISRIQADGTVSTIASASAPGFGGDGGPAAAARFAGVEGIAVGDDGSLFVADAGNNRVRKIDPDGTVGTLAGTGRRARAGDHGPALRADLAGPIDVALAADGSLFVAEFVGHCVRQIYPDGTIVTVAGTGTPGPGGDGGLATAAQLDSPRGVAVGPDSSLFIADAENARVRRVWGLVGATRLGC